MERTFTNSRLVLVVPPAFIVSPPHPCLPSPCVASRHGTSVRSGVTCVVNVLRLSWSPLRGSFSKEGWSN